MSEAGAPIWTAHAPGSLMCMGEHAVLHGKRALVCAVNRRLHATIEGRRDRLIRITSDLGEDAAPLDALPDRPPFRFVWATLRAHAPYLTAGCDIHLHAEFSATIGLGSSAAVTVALTAALRAHEARAVDRWTVFEEARRIIRSVQRGGSGADTAASVFGSLLEYRADPIKIEPLHATHPITVLYSGYKTPTPDVIAHVETERSRRPALFEGFFFEIDEAVRDAVDAICRDNWAELGLLLDRNQALLVAIGVSDPTLGAMVSALRADPAILGAKISGAGLGDCVLGLGHAQTKAIPYEQIPCAITQEGVKIEQA